MSSPYTCFCTKGSLLPLKLLTEDMLINVTFYFAIKSETMLLGILPTNTERVLQELLIYMITAARVVMTTKWKAKECPYSENWKNKMAEYAAMSKLQII